MSLFPIKTIQWRVHGYRAFISHLRVLLTALVVGTLLNGHVVPVGAQSSSDPLVLAYYYTWFDENTWTYDKLSDLPAQPYVSSDRSVMGRQIDQAKSAGIDAFLVAWYGPGGGNQTESNLTAMLDEAQARNFKIGILFETDSPFMGDVAGALQHALSVHANHPAFLRVDGRPVIFFWHPTNYGIGFWQNVRSQVDPNYSSIWISEGVDTSYLSVFDGHHLYSNTWNPPADLSYTDGKFARQVEAARQQYGAYKYWVATVMPGYNDVRIRPGSGFVQDREGGAYYQRSWQAAIGSQPNWIVITSFNEWPEGSYIEPSAAFGDQYLGLTAAGSQQFKSGGGVNVAASGLAAPAPLPPPPTPTPLPEPDAPTAYIDVDLANLRDGPGTDYSIVGRATTGMALAISGRDPNYADWWQVTENDQKSWVYGPLVRAAGPLDQVPVVASPLLTLTVTDLAAAIAVTETTPLSDTQPATFKPYLSHEP
ncbi:hypothetical protein BH10CHL1_BH10CHL1_36000 [soil metagenome]